MAAGEDEEALRAIYSGNKRPSPRRLMEGPVVWDSDVLVCFAQINRTQLIRAGFVNRSHIPKAVGRELRGLQNGYPTLASLLQPTHFATIHELTRQEADRAAELQRAWVGKVNWLNDPKRHRGEAECIQLCVRNELGGLNLSSQPAPMVSHDVGAKRAAISHGIDMYSCVEVFAVLAASGHLLSQNAWERWLDLAAPPVGYASRDWGVDAGDRTRFLTLVELLAT